MKRLSIVLLLIVVVLALAACGSAVPSVTEVEVTRLVEITRVVESIEEVEVTREVEVIQEVTRIVEIEVIATPTTPPEPTATPKPEGGTAAKPHPAGTPVSLTMNREGEKFEFDFGVTNVIRGDAALQQVMSANQFNDEPPSGWEYILIYMDVAYPNGEEILELEDYDLSIVTNGRIIEKWDDNSMVAGLDPDFELSLLPGGIGGGWASFYIAEGDPMPLLLLGGPDGVFFETAAPEVE